MWRNYVVGGVGLTTCLFLLAGDSGATMLEVMFTAILNMAVVALAWWAGSKLWGLRHG